VADDVVMKKKEVVLSTMMTQNAIQKKRDVSTADF
jgi:hypothetical protein